MSERRAKEPAGWGNQDGPVTPSVEDRLVFVEAAVEQLCALLVEARIVMGAVYAKYPHVAELNNRYVERMGAEGAARQRRQGEISAEASKIYKATYDEARRAGALAFEAAHRAEQASERYRRAAVLA